ncbi:MAG: DUF4342 domain-containing protein [Clostridia bacterium]|nr:DUF4342 domain-containing protein [Clostridia bacterium]
MMNNEMLQDIEYLREKANVTYEEAMELLETHGGNVMRVLVELEKRGLLYEQPARPDSVKADGCRRGNPCEPREKVASFFQKAKQSRLVVKKDCPNGEKETVANISALAAGGLAVCFPYLATVAVLLALLTGHQVKVEKKDQAK